MNREAVITIFIYTVLVFQLIIAYIAYKEIKTYNEKVTSCYDLLGLKDKYRIDVSEMGINTSYPQILINITSTTQ